MILGLTGSLGSGKSTVAKLLEELGQAKVIDADAIAHQVQAPGSPGYEEIVRVFGPGILKSDGAIDRKALGSIVFSDEKKRRLLNSIVHPRVRAEEERLLRLYTGDDLVVLMVPLLLENRMESMVDRVVVVTVGEENRRKRLAQRSQMSAEEVARRLQAQMPDQEKVGLADFVIDNSGSLEHTRKQVRELLSRLGSEQQLP